MLSEHLYALLFMQVTLDCSSFRRRMAPMEHLKKSPVVYGKWFFFFPRGFIFVLFLFIWLGFSPIYLYYHLMHQKLFFGDGFWKSGGCLRTFVMNNQLQNSLNMFSPWWKRFLLSHWLFCICHRVEIFMLMLNNNSLGSSECTILNMGQCIKLVCLSSCQYSQHI